MALDETGGAPRRAPRWMKITLGVSLALNLLVAGVVVGAVAFGPRDGSAGPDRAGFSGPLTRALSQSDQQALRADLRADRQSLREVRRSSRAARAEIITLLRADPFDAAAFSAAVTAQRQSIQTIVDRGETALVNRVAAMSRSERADYATRLEDMAKRRRPPSRSERP